MSVSVKWHVGACEKHTVEEAVAGDLCCLSVRDDSGHPVRKTPENLRLWAAAPQLLEACERALGLLWEEQARLDSPTPFDRTVEQLEAAIRAAREG